MGSVDNCQTLRDLGFEPAGQWMLDNGRPLPQMASGQSSRFALYAFELGGAIVFIGRARHAFGGDIGGNEPLGMTRHHTTENDRRIVTALMQGEDIEILEFSPSEHLEYRGWRVNIAAGLLDALVEGIKPEWNAGGGFPPKSTRPF
jgi:hypothetical protein